MIGVVCLLGDGHESQNAMGALQSKRPNRHKRTQNTAARHSVILDLGLVDHNNSGNASLFTTNFSTERFTEHIKQR